MTVSGKTTLALVGGMFASSYVGIAIAWTIGGISEWCWVRADNAAKLEEKARQRRLKRNASQTTKAQQEVTDAEIEKLAEGDNDIGYGDADESSPASNLLHPAGTEVLVTSGPNQSKEGKITEAGFCKTNQRYVVEIDGEPWYIPPSNVVSTSVPESGARVIIVGGKHVGREGIVGNKHDKYDLYHVVLEATPAAPAKVFVVERDPPGEGEEQGAWPLEFGEGDTATTIMKISGSASNAGLKKGMVITSINGDKLWDELGNISGETLKLEKQEGWWLDRNMFDIFKGE